MLYLIHRRSEELHYHGGQREVLHLVAKLEQAIHAAEGRPWAYSDGNAGANYTLFYKDLGKIDEVIDWSAVNATDWRDPAVKEKKQVEFLVHEYVPWTCFHEIGVHDEAIAGQVRALLQNASHVPEIVVRRSWYY